MYMAIHKKTTAGKTKQATERKYKPMFPKNICNIDAKTDTKGTEVEKLLLKRSFI